MLLASALMLLYIAVSTQGSSSGSDSAAINAEKSQADDATHSRPSATESTGQNRNTLLQADHAIQNMDIETQNPRHVQVSTVAKDSRSNRKRKPNVDQANDSPAEKHGQIGSATADITTTGSSLATGDSAETDGSRAAGSSLATDASLATGSLSTICTASGSGASSSASGLITSHKRINFSPLKPISLGQAIKQSKGLTIGVHWNKVLANVYINDYTIYSGGISGNEKDLADVGILEDSVESSPRMRLDYRTLLSLSGNVWKFLLQALTFPRQEEVAVRWQDYSNRIFKIVNEELLCDDYYQYKNVQSTQTTSRQMHDILQYIKACEKTLVDKIPLITPLLGEANLRVFQFGRVEVLELYRTYLEDARYTARSLTSGSSATGALSASGGPSATSDTLATGDSSTIGGSAPASGSSVAASSLAIGSFLPVSQPQIICFNPPHQPAIEELLPRGYRPRVEAFWYQVRTSVAVGDFIVFHDTISGNQIDIPDAVPNRHESETIHMLLDSPHPCLWKFLLQVLAFSPPQGHGALQWDDEPNGMFRIVDVNALCAFYRDFRLHFVDQRDVYNIQHDNASIMGFIRDNIEKGQRALNDGRPIFTPFMNNNNREEFQFGRHAALKLYWQYLIDVKSAAARRMMV